MIRITLEANSRRSDPCKFKSLSERAYDVELGFAEPEKNETKILRRGFARRAIGTINNSTPLSKRQKTTGVITAYLQVP